MIRIVNLLRLFAFIVFIAGVVSMFINPDISQCLLLISLVLYTIDNLPRI